MPCHEDHSHETPRLHQASLLLPHQILLEEICLDEWQTAQRSDWQCQHLLLVWNPTTCNGLKKMSVRNQAEPYVFKANFQIQIGAKDYMLIVLHSY